MIWRTLTILLGVLFLFAGGTKLIGTQMHVEHFALWGYPSWFRLFVGAWEVGCGLLLLIPRYSFYAATCLVVAMIGAVYTEAFRGTPTMAVTPAVLLVLLASAWPGIRTYFPNISPNLINILSNGQGATAAGVAMLLGEMGLLGFLGAAIHLIPGAIRRPLITALLITGAVALFSDVPLNIANELLERKIVRVLFGTKGLTVAAAVGTFVIRLLLAFWWDRSGRAAINRRQAAQTPTQTARNRRIATIVLLLVLLVLPRMMTISGPPAT